MRRARENKDALYPFGGGTMLGLGLPPTRAGIAIDTRGLGRLIDYPARDMTITVQTGITISKLGEILAAEKQWLPVEVPMSDSATLGGALSSNVSGPRRFGQGTLRDYLIGISIANDEGQEIKAGGRVVKNVAGYDLGKLYIGALGTLGIITQATLKLKPAPEARAVMLFSCQDTKLDDVLNRVHATRTRPDSIDVLNEPAASKLSIAPFGLQKDHWLVVVGFEGNSNAVGWQVTQVRDEVREFAASEILNIEGRLAEESWRRLTDFTLLPEFELTFKANYLPSGAASFCRCVGVDAPTLVHAGNGIAIGHIASNDLENVREFLGTLAAEVAKTNGNLVLLRCPFPWKKTLPVWGKPPGSLNLMRSVKAKLDPDSIFNPGRFVGGI